jgi:hypothetical protein
MLNAAITTDVTINGQIVGHIGECCGGLLSFHQDGIGGFVECISAVKPVLTEEPEVARDRDCRSSGRRQIHRRDRPRRVHRVIESGNQALEVQIR